MVLKYSSRFWLYAPITDLPAASPPRSMAHWWVVADAFEKKLAALKGHEAIPGITLDWDKVEVGGFPFRLDADFTAFRVQGAGAHGPFAWNTREIRRCMPSPMAAPRRSMKRRAASSCAGPMRMARPSASISCPARCAPAASSMRKGLGRFDLDIVGLARQGLHHRPLPIAHAPRSRRPRPGPDAAGRRRRRDQTGACLCRAQPWRCLCRLAAGGAILARGGDAWRAQGGEAKLSQVVAPGLVAGHVALAALLALVAPEVRRRGILADIDNGAADGARIRPLPRSPLHPALARAQGQVGIGDLLRRAVRRGRRHSPAAR